MVSFTKWLMEYNNVPCAETWNGSEIGDIYGFSASMTLCSVLFITAYHFTLSSVISHFLGHFAYAHNRKFVFMEWHGVAYQTFQRNRSGNLKSRKTNYSVQDNSHIVLCGIFACYLCFCCPLYWESEGSVQTSAGAPVPTWPTALLWPSQVFHRTGG